MIKIRAFMLVKFTDRKDNLYAYECHEIKRSGNKLKLIYGEDCITLIKPDDIISIECKTSISEDLK